MAKKTDPARNVRINDATWKNTGILAAQLGVTKQELVTRALDFYHQTVTKNK